MISVAMCTYNGERYIQEQIKSMLAQTLPPDEIIICDDGSTDHTVGVIKRMNDERIKLYQNQENLGITKNFEQAVKMCSGDIVFFSDQDDVWLPNKIQTIMQAFYSNPNAYMIFTDAYLTNDKLKVFDASLWEAIGFDCTEFNETMLFTNFVATGATMAIKREAFELIFPFSEVRFHDAWIALILTLLGHTAFINEKLIYYRQHEKQRVGVRIKNGKIRRHNPFTVLRTKLIGISLRQYLKFLPLLSEVQKQLQLKQFTHQAAYVRLTDYIEHLETRVKLPENKIARYKAIRAELPRYLKYETKIIALRDFFKI